MSNSTLSIIAIVLIVGGSISLRVLRDTREELDARTILKPMGLVKETEDEETYWAKADAVYWSAIALLLGIILLLYVGCEAMMSS